MKRISFIIMLFFLLNLVSQAQKPYSSENLKQLSQEELDSCLNKALKLQKSGKTVNIIGGVIVGTGVLTAGTLALAVEGSEMIVAAALIFSGITGLGTLMVGIPMNSTGKKRVERINNIKDTAFNGITIDLKPCTQYNLMTQNYQTGITLRIRF